MKAQSNSRNPLPIPPEGIAILRTAATNKHAWRQAQKDPIAYLKKRRVAVPGDVSVSLRELVIPPTGLVANANDVERPLGDPTDPPIVSSPVRPNPGLERWWESTHMGCPLGTYPHTTRRYEAVCIKQGVVHSQVEWIPDSDESPNVGRFGFRDSWVVCLQTILVPLDVIECVPLSVIKS